MKKQRFHKKIKPDFPSDCREIQKLNGEFICGELPYKTELAFVKHVRKCPSCMEELKAYFMFYTTVRYLNEYGDSNIPQTVDVLLKKIEDEEYNRKVSRRNWIIAFLALFGGLGILGSLLFRGALF